MRTRQTREWAVILVGLAFVAAFVAAPALAEFTTVTLDPSPGYMNPTYWDDIPAMITGLTNIQSIRTADIAGVRAVVYCRGKRPDRKVVDFARQKRIPVLVTPMVMFDICDILYAKGLKGVS
jgi:hypothetical protein